MEKSQWIEFVKLIREQNPEMSYKEALKISAPLWEKKQKKNHRFLSKKKEKNKKSMGITIERRPPDNPFKIRFGVPLRKNDIKENI